MGKLQPWVVLAVATPLAAGAAIYEYGIGRGHDVRFAFVAATALAAAASFCAIVYARRKGRPALSTPPAIANVVFSASCILLVQHVVAAFIVIWAANLAMSVWGLIRAIKADRLSQAHDQARRAARRMEGED